MGAVSGPSGTCGHDWCCPWHLGCSGNLQPCPAWVSRRTGSRRSSSCCSHSKCSSSNRDSSGSGCGSRRHNPAASAVCWWQRRYRSRWRCFWQQPPWPRASSAWPGPGTTAPGTPNADALGPFPAAACAAPGTAGAGWLTAGAGWLVGPHRCCIRQQPPTADPPSVSRSAVSATQPQPAAAVHALQRAQPAGRPRPQLHRGNGPEQ